MYRGKCGVGEGRGVVERGERFDKDGEGWGGRLSSVPGKVGGEMANRGLGEGLVTTGMD